MVVLLDLIIIYVISPKYTQKSDQQRKFEPQKQVPKLYSCALCEAIFDSENGLDEHMNNSGH